MRRNRWLGFAALLAATTLAACASSPAGEHCGRELPPVWDAPVMAQTDTAAPPRAVVGVVVSQEDGGPGPGDCGIQPAFRAGPDEAAL